MAVEYALPEPWYFQQGSTVYWTTFEMCDDPPYDNCWIRTRVNIPDRAWDARSGQVVWVEVYGFSNNDCIFIARNNVTGNFPQIVDFLFKKGMPTLFYVKLYNERVTGLHGTFSVRIDCDSFSKVQRKPNLKSNLLDDKISSVIPCGTPNSMMNITYRPSNPYSVKTAKNFDDWYQIKLFICLPKRYKNLHYRAQAVDTKSAVSSRACTYFPCDINYDVAADRSGSAINEFDVYNYGNKPLYVSLEGWGEYEGMNQILTTIEVS
jgi:hypothetical protein